MELWVKGLPELEFWVRMPGDLNVKSLGNYVGLNSFDIRSLKIFASPISLLFRLKRKGKS